WSRARGLFAGVALDGAALTIDDAANEAVYGRDTTPRMIFEGRARQQPSDAVVDFRDRLEEATAVARAARGTDAAHAARVPVQEQAPARQQASIELPPADEARPEPFQPVEDNPATVEPLP